LIVIQGPTEGHFGEGFGEGEQFGWPIWGVGFGGGEFVDVGVHML
jgi:hypothetical protein